MLFCNSIFGNCDHRDIVQTLLRHKSDVNFVNEHGNTPLHYACFWGYTDIADDLIDAGALVTIQNKYQVWFGFSDVKWFDEHHKKFICESDFVKSYNNLAWIDSFYLRKNPFNQGFVKGEELCLYPDYGWL